MVQRELADTFLQDIESGAVVADGQIPTFRALSLRYGCSVTTVKRMVDDLVKLGKLRVIRGRGTFVTSEESPAVPRRSQLVGAIVLEDQFKDALEKCTDEFLNQGWMFSVYHSGPDSQSPERERRFLSKAQELAFGAIVMEASPIAPVNTEFFRRLRSDGMKIIHLSPYLDDMSGECAFMPGFKNAGLLATVKAALAGYRNIAFLPAGSEAPYCRLVFEGIQEIAGEIELTILDDVPSGRKEEAVRAFLSSLPEKTALVSLDTEMGNLVMDSAATLAMTAGKEFGLVSILESPGETARHSFMTFDYDAIIHDALAFAIDPARLPFESVCHLYPAHYCDRGSL